MEKARQNRLEDSRRKREKITCQSKGAISDLLSDYSDVNFISKDYVEGQQRKWKLKSAAVANETDRAKLSFKFAQNLLKIIAINRTNLDTLEKKVKEKLAEELPDLDLGEIERAAAALNSPDQLKKEGGKVDSNSADGHDEEESDGREELNTCNEDSDCHGK